MSIGYTPPSPGIPGPMGPTGPCGQHTIQIIQGPTGPQGATGNTGPAGFPGSQGSTGPQGAAGAQGATGDPGSQGSTGPQGAAGAQGATGDPGSQGPTGPQGATGGPPAGVGFSATKTISSSYLGGQSIDVDITTDWDTTINGSRYNIGNNFSNGFYTIPVNGLYNVNAKVTIHPTRVGGATGTNPPLSYPFGCILTLVGSGPTNLSSVSGYISSGSGDQEYMTLYINENLYLAAGTTINLHFQLGVGGPVDPSNLITIMANPPASLTTFSAMLLSTL